MCFRRLVILSIVNALLNCEMSLAENADSLRKDFTFDSFFSTSILSNFNWRNISNSGINLFTSVNLVYKKTEEDLLRINEFSGELGYVKYLDSTWVKMADNAFINYIRTTGNKKQIQHSITFNLKTQLTNSWSGYNKPDERKWLSGPLLPATFVAGYGMTIPFNKNSFLNLAFASLKFSSRPRKEFSDLEIKNSLITKKVIYNSLYGFQLQCRLEFEINRTIKWEYRTVLFVSGIDKKEITFDAQNIFSMRPIRLLRIKFEQRLAYDLLMSEKLQARIELMLGIVL